MKTLNDLRCARNSEFSCCEDRGRSGNPHHIDTEELRQEAKKWVEALNKEEKGYYGANSSPLVAKHTKQWIKHFFNLEEEKL